MPVLIGEFALQGSLNNNVSGGPSLVALPFSSVFGQITSTGYVFGANQGLTFTSPALSSTSFSIELSFKFDATSGWRKIADFANLVPDTGLYNLNGALQVYPQSAAATADFAPGTAVDVMLTRNFAGTVIGYVNGQQRFTFNDSISNDALITAANDELIFFVDDHATGQDEASSGTANYIRIYDDALSASAVNALFLAGAPSAIPEPSICAAVLGTAAFGFSWRRRRNGARA